MKVVVVISLVSIFIALNVVASDEPHSYLYYKPNPVQRRGPGSIGYYINEANEWVSLYSQVHASLYYPNRALYTTINRRDSSEYNISVAFPTYHVDLAFVYGMRKFSERIKDEIRSVFSADFGHTMVTLTASYGRKNFNCRMIGKFAPSRDKNAWVDCNPLQHNAVNIKGSSDYYYSTTFANRYFVLQHRNVENQGLIFDIYRREWNYLPIGLPPKSKVNAIVNAQGRIQVQVILNEETSMIYTLVSLHNNEFTNKYMKWQLEESNGQRTAQPIAYIEESLLAKMTFHANKRYKGPDILPPEVLRSISEFSGENEYDSEPLRVGHSFRSSMFQETTKAERQRFQIAPIKKDLLDLDSYSYVYITENRNQYEFGFYNKHRQWQVLATSQYHQWYSMGVLADDVASKEIRIYGNKETLRITNYNSPNVETMKNNLHKGAMVLDGVQYSLDDTPPNLFFSRRWLFVPTRCSSRESSWSGSIGPPWSRVSEGPSASWPCGTASGSSSTRSCGCSCLPQPASPPRSTRCSTPCGGS